MAGPRSDPSHAERPPRAVRRSLIVELPLQSAALTGAVGSGHCPAVGTDPNRCQPKTESQKGDYDDGSEATRDAFHPGMNPNHKLTPTTANNARTTVGPHSAAALSISAISG